MKRQILFLMPSMGIGGAEKVMINLLKLIDDSRFRITLVIANGSEAYLDEVPEYVSIQILCKNRIVDKLARELYIRFGISFLMKRHANRIKGKYQAGISFLDSVYTDLLFFSPACFQRKIAVVQSSYISYASKIKGIKGKHLVRMKERYSKLDTIVTVSQDSMNEFKSLFGEYNDMRVIYNPINFEDVRKLSNEEPEIEHDQNLLNIVAVGRLIPVKGYEMLLRACKILSEENFRFNLFIVGKGSLENKLKELAGSLELTEHVKITGFVKNAYAIINIADIYVMSSFSEGLPTSLCEAMILEKPVLVTNVSGCKEVVDYGEYGVMVEPDELAIADGLKRLISQPDLRKKYSSLSSQRSKLFNDENVMNSYYDLMA